MTHQHILKQEIISSTNEEHSRNPNTCFAALWFRGTPVEEHWFIYKMWR